MKTFYQNRLPHIAPIGATFFVTFRLGDALPQTVLRAIKAELEARKKALLREAPQCQKIRLYEAYKRFYAKYDRQLDHEPYGACYLKDPAIAEIVTDKLHEFDGKYYDLQAYCIMPNHVHLLIDTMKQLELPDYTTPDGIPKDYVQLDKIMQRIKGGTAYSANLALNRSGRFWQKDSYDHYVRNERERANIIAYILNNPVKARLVKNWQDWPFTFCKYCTGDFSRR